MVPHCGTKLGSHCGTAIVFQLKRGQGTKMVPHCGTKMGPFFDLIFLHLGFLFWSLFRPHFHPFWVSLLAPLLGLSFLILGVHFAPVFRPHFPHFEGLALLLVSSTGSSSRSRKAACFAPQRILHLWAHFLALLSAAQLLWICLI